MFEADYGSKLEFQFVKLLENLRQIQTIVMNTHYTCEHFTCVKVVEFSALELSTNAQRLQV